MIKWKLIREGSEAGFGPFHGQILTFPDPPSLQIQSNFCGLKWLVHVSQTFTTSFMWKCFFSKSSLKPTLIFTTLFQFRCTFEANVNSNLGKISLQAVCHHGEENLTGVSEKYNWNFDTNPTYWVVRYSVEHSHSTINSYVRGCSWVQKK